MDIFVEQTIHAAPEEVAKVMFDPTREGEWMAKGATAELLTQGPLAVGTRIRHEAGVHGRLMPFVTEVVSLDPGRKLEMKIENSEDGVITYQVAPTAGGAIASIHMKGEAVAYTLRSKWSRKQHERENLLHLALAVNRAHAAEDSERLAT
jgi:uncharacterized protein YndB with AHSA1/START domain